MSFFGWYLTRISLLTHYVNFSSAFAQNSFCLSFLNLKRKVMRLEGQKESPTQKIYANFAQLGIRQLQNGEASDSEAKVVCLRCVWRNKEGIPPLACLFFAFSCVEEYLLRILSWCLIHASHVLTHTFSLFLYFFLHTHVRIYICTLTRMLLCIYISVSFLLEQNKRVTLVSHKALAFGA